MNFIWRHLTRRVMIVLVVIWLLFLASFSLKLEAQYISTLGVIVLLIFGYAGVKTLEYHGAKASFVVPQKTLAEVRDNLRDCRNCLVRDESTEPSESTQSQGRSE